MHYNNDNEIFHLITERLAESVHDTAGVYFVQPSPVYMHHTGSLMLEG